MNANEFFKMVENMTEKERSEIIIPSYWTLGMVEEEMKKRDSPLDKFTYEEKIQILEEACDNEGTESEFCYRLPTAVEDMLIYKMDGKQSNLESIEARTDMILAFLLLPSFAIESFYKL